jgi:hypothetical protein
MVGVVVHLLALNIQPRRKRPVNRIFKNGSSA